MVSGGKFENRTLLVLTGVLLSTGIVFLIEFCESEPADLQPAASAQEITVAMPRVIMADYVTHSTQANGRRTAS